MIALASGVRVWLATGHTDMRKALRAWRCASCGQARRMAW